MINYEYDWCNEVDQSVLEIILNLETMDTSYDSINRCTWTLVPH